MKGDIYHIVNRGFEKSKIFLCENDYLRFVCGLYKFNNRGQALYLDTNSCFIDPPKQDKTVEILKWSLIPNHYHLLLQEKVDGGAIDFVKRIGNGYTKYFNIKNNRSGYLFQNSAKIVPVRRNEHLLHLPFYIDTNPLNLMKCNWKTGGIKNAKNAIHFLESYRWSDFQDYMGNTNFPNIINKNAFYELFETGKNQYKRDLIEWLSDFNVPR